MSVDRWLHELQKAERHMTETTTFWLQNAMRFGFQLNMALVWPESRVSGRNMLERWAGPLAKWFSSWRIPWIGPVGPVMLIQIQCYLLHLIHICYIFLCCFMLHVICLLQHISSTFNGDAIMPAWMCSLQPRRVTMLRHIKTIQDHNCIWDSVEWFEEMKDHFTSWDVRSIHTHYSHFLFTTVPRY